MYTTLYSMKKEDSQKIIDKCSEYHEYELQESYEEMLNECYDVINICGYEYEPAKALRDIDPVAYREGFMEYLNHDEWTEFDGKYYRTDDLENAHQEWEDEQEELNDILDNDPLGVLTEEAA